MPLPEPPSVGATPASPGWQVAVVSRAVGGVCVGEGDACVAPTAAVEKATSAGKATLAVSGSS